MYTGEVVFKRPRSTGVESMREDRELLLAVAQERDRSAFNELFIRYKKSAIYLAAQITHNREDAEEAVQEGFHRIWISAGSFRTEYARSWILRIIIRESTRINRTKRREKGKQHMEQQALEYSLASA